MAATIDVLLPFYGGFITRGFPKLETKTSAPRSERMTSRGLSLESGIAKREKSGTEGKSWVHVPPCVLRLEERFGCLSKPRCPRYLFFTSGKEAFSNIDNAN